MKWLKRLKYEIDVFVLFANGVSPKQSAAIMHSRLKQGDYGVKQNEQQT